MSTLPPASSREPRRILVRGVNWLGDAVMSTPALRRLRERFPAAHIALLTHAKLAGLWTGHPALDAVIPFAADAGALAIGRQLRAHNFDLALVLPNSPRSALESWIARIPRRVGYRRSWRNWFLTDCVADRPGAVTMHKRTPGEVRRLVARGTGQIVNSPAAPGDPAAHHVHQYLHLTAALGANPAPLPPALGVSDAEVAAVANKFELSAGTRWLALNPGAEYGPAKRWPAERFSAAAQEIQKRSGNVGWIILGGAADVQLAATIASAIGRPPAALRNLAGRTSLRELCAVLKLSRVLLTNDTGPMHVGAAVGTPVVALFGSTSPELTGPGLPGEARHTLLRGAAPCAPCYLRTCPIDFRCLQGIAVETVVAAVLRSLAEGRGLAQ
ncbi:MAG TPA: lipopolysaccharide heptosyltransferase II [Verrucomicrobiae bacterium]|nr:lipopolysaccharide heptosyltransferase II [Verrucomicrobiae bacterium]